MRTGSGIIPLVVWGRLAPSLEFSFKLIYPLEDSKTGGVKAESGSAAFQTFVKEFPCDLR